MRDEQFGYLKQCIQKNKTEVAIEDYIAKIPDAANELTQVLSPSHSVSQQKDQEIFSVPSQLKEVTRAPTEPGLNGPTLTAKFDF